MFKKSQKTAAVGVALSSLCLVLAGCGMSGSMSTPITTTGTGVALQGRVFGGQQPLVGAVVNLYAAGTTGYGSPYPAGNGGSVSLLGTHVVTTDAGGSFNISGDYTCPTGSYVYIEAVGGSPDGVLADNNPNVIMLAALGLCSNLSSSSYITMNELTTVASVWALAPFMTGPTNIGTSASNSVGLSNAFASVNTLVNVGTGYINTSLPAGATIPTAELNTLGNILAACVNVTMGYAGASGNACTLLFPAATPTGGTQPTDTLTAAMNIAQHPGNNVGSLFPIAGKYAQFGPTVLNTAPNDWTVAIRYTGGGALTANTRPLGVAADQQGNIWVSNDGTTAANTKLVEFSPTGTLIASHAHGAYAGVAIDLAGNAWGSYTYLVKNTPGATGTTTTLTGGGGQVSGDIPAITVDGSGNVWATTLTAGDVGRIVEYSTTTSSFLSPAGGYTGGGTSGTGAPGGIAIDPH
jgi:hypothetical protein